MFPDQRRSALYREREQQPARQSEQCDSPGCNGEISHDILLKDKLLFLMIAILTSYHPLRFVFSPLFCCLYVLGGRALLSNLILNQHFFEDPWKLCSDRRWSNRQDDDFTEEWVRSWCWLGGLGVVLGLGKRPSQGYCFCGSCAFWVEPKWWLYHLHDRFARALLQSRSHYQRRGRYRASTFPSLWVHLHGDLTLSVLCIHSPQLSFSVFKGVWGCTSLREDDGTSPANYALAKWLLVSQNMQTYLQKSYLDAQLAWMVLLCAAEAHQERAETNTVYTL